MSLNYFLSKRARGYWTNLGHEASACRASPRGLRPAVWGKAPEGSLLKATRYTYGRDLRFKPTILTKSIVSQIVPVGFTRAREPDAARRLELDFGPNACPGLYI